ncbi:MAG: DUF370 domain-containing protein [Clostridia bacterium]|nr:DUF370 domain-containing protein [Clostridia bacterium]
MYIHIGNNALLDTNEIIGIFDLDNTTVSARTRDFLNGAQRKGKVFSTGNELPKSFVVASRGKGDNRVFLAVLAPATLSKRAESKNYFKETYEKAKEI